MNINFEELITSLVSPLIVFPEELVVKNISTSEHYLEFQVLVRKEDLGRVIGKSGKIATAIRTICYAGATKENKRLRIEFDAF